MFQSIWDDVKREFQHGNMVTRIIIVNITVFILVNIGKLILRSPIGGNGAFEDFLHFFCMSPDWKFLITHPWTPFTSIVLHEDFGHVFWNMLSFYWFGRVVGDLLGNHRILPLYILGGLAGGLVYFIAANLHMMGLGHSGEFALGASAAVMAMMACAAYIAPDYIFNVLLIGPVRLKYIALVLILLDLTAIADRDNTGGHLAHLGGVVFGLLFASQLQKGNDWAKPVEKIIAFFQHFFQPKTLSPKNNYAKNNARQGFKTQKDASKTKKTDNKQTDEQSQLDIILDKIKQKGYDSLTQVEKDFLFNASKK